MLSDKTRAASLAVAQLEDALKRAQRVLLFQQISDDSGGQVTLYDMMTASERDYAAGQRFSIVPDQPFVKCPGCDYEIHTELDYAMHFVVPDPFHRNLGYCPVAGAIRAQDGES